MKRRDLLKHIFLNGCEVLREGAKHTVVYNPNNNFTSTVPRHNEINDFLAKKICKDLGINF